MTNLPPAEFQWKHLIIIPCFWIGLIAWGVGVCYGLFMLLSLLGRLF